jgi:hypothetical protein
MNDSANIYVFQHSVVKHVLCICKLNGKLNIDVNIKSILKYKSLII